MLITGLTLIKDGNLLKYPWKICISNLSSLCDEVIVNLGDSTDDTKEELFELSELLGNVKVFEYTWSLKPTGDGTELSKQANHVLSEASGDWIIYMQADEMIHERDHSFIRSAIKNVDEDITQFELYRSYFWRTLSSRNSKYEIWLGRIFKANTHEVGGDGMYLIRFKGEVERLNKLIYHYSRIGTEEEINKRVRRLTLMFEGEEYANSLEGFKYSEIEKKDLVSYISDHPEGIKEFYNG